MKKYWSLIFRGLTFPIRYCYRVIQDAPVVCSDNGLIGFTDFNDFLTPEEPCSSHFKVSACKVSSSGGEANA